MNFVKIIFAKRLSGKIMVANARDCQWRSGQTKYEEEEIEPIVTKFSLKLQGKCTSKFKNFSTIKWQSVNNSGYIWIESRS